MNGVLIHLNSGKKHPLKGTTVIGRKSGSVIFHGDAHLSSEHCRFAWDSKGDCIEDLYSTNGTLLNGSVLTPGVPRPLNSGDRIVAGRQRFIYAFEGQEFSARLLATIFRFRWVWSLVTGTLLLLLVSLFLFKHAG